MYRIMEDWTDIRERVASGKVSKRAILRETGMHWKTLKKILTHSEPPGYRLRQARPQQKLGPYQERIEQILKEDQLLPRKQRHTAKRVAVAQILGGGKERRLTHGFLQLKSHYLFAHHFCRIRRGNEKGVVEGLVKFTRLNFFVPVAQVRDFDELNAFLRQRCEEDRQRRLRGQPGTKAQLLVEDQTAFLPLPVAPFEACRNTNYVN